jgi:hypothetical protein
MSLRIKRTAPSQTPERTLKLPGIRLWQKIPAAIIGSLATYLVWRLVYQSQMPLPYPEELSLLLEALWGALLGFGPFLGLAALQTGHGLRGRAGDEEVQDAHPKQQRPAKDVRDAWACVFLATLGGLVGGIAWWFIALWSPLDSRTLGMTGLWAFVYTSSVLLPPASVRRSRRAYILIVPLAVVPVAGFLLTKWVHIAPDQADVDMSVGLWLRVALIIGAILLSPVAIDGKRNKHHATGEQISLLMQTMMQKKRWLTKSGMLIHLAEELSYSPATVRKLCSGERRPSAEAAKKLLQLGKEAGLDREWGSALLEATHHFDDRQMAHELDATF